MNENQTPAQSESQVQATGTKVPSQVKLRPTKKQKELLTYIEQFIAEHGYSPSYREIMNGMQYTSVATVALHVRNLIARGHLVKRDHSARSLEVVNSAGVSAASAKGKSSAVKKSEERWLVDKVKKLIADVESQDLPTEPELRDVETLLDALRILGLEDAAASFTARLSHLQAQLRTND